jgi:hypothetical protein
MTLQLNLDLNPARAIDSGKKTERITFTGSEDLKEFLSKFALKQNTTVSELIQRYVISGLQSDLGNILLVQANGQKTLNDLLKR